MQTLRSRWNAYPAWMVLVLLCLAVPVAARADVPFKATFSGDTEITPGIPDCTHFPRLIGGGQATHLGRYTATLEHDVDVCSDPFPILRGSMTLTAANGDQLFGTNSGTFFLGPGGLEAGLLFFEINVTLTGGTGRFRNTEGNIVVTGVANLGTCQVLPGQTFPTCGTTAQLVGTLSSVGERSDIR